MSGDTQRPARRIADLLFALALISPVARADAGLEVAVRTNVLRLPVEQAQGPRFQRLSTADGLSQTRVAQIVQDNLGFMWFGTQYGLNRYDGYNFKLFVHEPGNDESAAGTFVYALFKDRDGLIWIGWSEGLDRLDTRTETFTHYRIEREEAGGGNTIVHISQDRSGMLWLATGSGLHRLDPASGAITAFRHRPSARSLPTNNVNWSGEDSRGRFWVGTSKGLSEFDRATGQVLRHVPLPDSVQISLFEDRTGQFWITQASGNGLSRFDPDANTVQPYSFYGSDPGPMALTGVMGVTEDKDGNLWIGSPGRGLLRLNRERNRFYHYGHRPQDVHSIAENKVIALLRDRDGNIWTGLHSAGVNYFGGESQRFEVFRHVPGDPNSLTLDFVNAILEDRDGTLWIGNDDGLNRIDRRTGRRELIDLRLGPKPMIISLAQDEEGAIWVGTFAHGLTRYYPHDERLESYMHDPDDPRSLSNNQVHRIYVDRGGTVWVATDDGLARFDRIRRDFTVYKRRNDSRFGQSYASIAEDAAGYLWLGSIYSGLHRFDPRSGQITVYRRNRGDPDGLRDNTVATVHASSAGILWIGTQNGLNSLDLKTGVMRAYDTRDGMPANTVACILEDAQGAVWLSTTKGLSKFTPATGTFANYSLDGLPGNDLTGWSTCSKSRRGELFFAGFSGAVAFVPTALRDTPPETPLVLTHFTIDGVEASIGDGHPLGRAIAYSDRVTLSHEQRNFSVTFAGLHYANPSATRYRYRLDGLDSSWRESPSSIRQATYTTLPPGQYSLRVQKAAEQGNWQSPGVALTILVLPPWWATWWFRAASALLVLVLGWLAVRARIRYVRREVMLQMEARNNERMRIAQDLHDTLLQGLLSASFQLSVVQDELAPAAKARPLLEHVSNLLRQLVQEGRNTVRGLRTWGFDSEDLEHAIGTVPDDLQIESSAQYRVSVEGQPRALLPAKRTEAYLIAREAISNALRHANASVIEVSLEYLPDTFRLTVRDDGRGFGAQTVAERSGSHFGLAVMNERAERLGGVLSISSGPDIGTEIVLSAPAKAMYRPESSRSL